MPYPLSNILLDSLSESSRKSLVHHLRPVPLPVKTPLYDPDDVPKYVHFLTSGIASIVTSMTGGETTEVGTVGREGVPQAMHVLGPVKSLLDASCKSREQDYAWSIKPLNASSTQMIRYAVPH